MQVHIDHSDGIAGGQDARVLRYPKIAPVLLPRLDSEMPIAFGRIPAGGGKSSIIEAGVDAIAMLRPLARENQDLTLFSR